MNDPLLPVAPESESTASSSDAVKRAAAVRDAMPSDGLFAEKDWLVSPRPFAISEAFADELDKLGYRLHLFIRACNLLYNLSVKGKQPAWIADYLDRGKPRELVEFARRKECRDELARVIRPDILLTENGIAISELDSVPGGIGLTAWLGKTYAGFGFDVLGGAEGMLDGFRSILPGGDIAVSEEAATYKPEMRWLAQQLNIREGAEKWRVADAETFSPASPLANGSANETDGGEQEAKAVYRFFELFDLPNIPSAPEIMKAVANGEITITPPMKPQIEEKMGFALFWLRPLREFWRREIGERHFLKLQEVIPYTWIMDPEPLPQHAVIPELGIQDWRELAGFSQKQRDLILKISGFSELGWGARSVALGSDMPQHDWKDAIENALAQFPKNPYILQRFQKSRLVEQPYVDFANGETGENLQIMKGRVRLCPYYFLADGKAKMGGALATICPADKKLLHGMKDAILAPTMVVSENAD